MIKNTLAVLLVISAVAYFIYEYKTCSDKGGRLVQGLAQFECVERSFND